MVIIHVANIIEEGKLGGPQVRIAMVASALDREIITTVVMPKENSELFREKCDTLGIPYKTFSITRITKEWTVAVRYVLFSLFEIVQLTRYFRRSGIHLVHVSGGSWQYKGVIAGKLAGKKVLWHLNDTYMPALFRYLFSMISHFSDGFIFASRRSRDYYGPLMGTEKPEFIIPAPVDTEQFDPKVSCSGDEELIARWSGKFVIGTVANINPIKGLEVLIQSAAILNKKIDNARIVVIGALYKNQHQYFEKLQNICHSYGVENIDFVGPRSDVRSLLNRFDVYVCSSHAESSPLSVWEAMSMEKPVISTDVGDVPLYIKNNHNGYIVSVADSGAIAEKLFFLSRNPHLGEKFGKISRDLVKRELDVKVCSNKHAQAYLNILKATN